MPANLESNAEVNSLNKIAVVAMMKNEADIVESSIRHWAKFADKIFVCDHKSTDRTHEILDLLKDEGLNLEISTHDTDEKAQMEVTNGLFQKALSEGFDLILPLDTDEFPVLVDGNSEDLRRHFQNLDTNHCYRTYCWEHRFADDNESLYALSREIVRAKSFHPGLPKVIIGRKIAIEHKASISFGNHNVYFEDLPPNYSVIDDTKIIYVHLSYRGIGQTASKRILNYLGTDLQVTRYNARKENLSPQEMADSYFGKKRSKIDLSEYLPTDLSAYKDECINKFSGGGASILVIHFSFSQRVMPILSIEKGFYQNEKSFGSSYSSMVMLKNRSNLSNRFSIKLMNSKNFSLC